MRCCGSRAPTRRAPATSAAALGAAALLGACGGGDAPTTTVATTPLPADLRPHTDSTEAQGRPAIVAAAERAITRDARSRVRRHEFRGPVLRTSCQERGGPGEGHQEVVVYSCLAITFVGPRTSTAPPLATGQLFQVRIDFGARRFTWCKYQPPGGEGTGRRGSEQPPPDACGGVG